MVTWLIMLCSIMILLADGSSTEPQPAADPPILRYAGQRIVGGTWGIVGQFQTALEQKLQVCAMHMTISADRINRVREAIAARESQVGRPLTPSERRREIGQALVATLHNQVEDRRGRNVVYYIDGVGADALSAAEQQAWHQRSGFTAAQFGLADRPMTVP